jgi:hypothetical protein
MSEFLTKKIEPDWQGLLDCIMRKGTPDRVYYIELFIDGEIKDAVCERFNLLDNLAMMDEGRNY